MKLEIKNASPEDAQRYQEAFGILTQAMGIANEKAVVNLDFFYSPEKFGLEAFLTGFTYEGAYTASEMEIMLDGTKILTVKINTAPPPINFSTKMASFVHEMQHVTQMVTGRLDTDPPFNVWDGKHYRFGEIDYNERPWEVDARQAAERFYPLVKSLDPEGK